MKSILFSRIGFTDLKASRGEKDVGLGPVAQAVTECLFQEIILISDVPDSDCTGYINWLKTLTSAHIRAKKVILSSPTNFGDIYEAAVWIIIAKTRFPATLIESSTVGNSVCH